ncbi:hypothetical protein SUGI_0195500 [Cryptomeria japonica]|uniref:probable folate-biopterin transporter 7 n=1 Tax=Cryptomeria japonica TaxID=3369 RepID=UPI002408C47E|nr:probable folate-biopterin transporter 7 [Cryptomeria japonica]GLJ12670.1 hypothetical protein SUGI_0195500 [Cryptomeria japonica]
MELSTTLMVLVGIGYWIHGFRCFPWLAVTFYLKDNLRVESVTLQLLQSSANLPMVAKPIYGIISDAVYIGGAHRLPYIIIGGLLQAISWGSIVFIPAAGSSVPIMSAFLLLSNLGASIVEVANDALVAETGKNAKASSSGELQSFAWMATAAGGIMGNLLGGIAIGRVDAKAMFIFFGLLLGIQVIICLTVDEKSLGSINAKKVVGQKSIHANQHDRGGVDTRAIKSNSIGGAFSKSVQKQVLDLLEALRKPEIKYSIVWFAASYAMIPILTGTMFFYQTQHLKLDPTILGLAKVVGQIGLLLGSVIYNRFLKSISLRMLLGCVQILLSLCMLSDIILVKQLNTQLGIPNSVYILGASALVEVISQFKILPFTVMLAQYCPPGCEGSLMAFIMSVQALTTIVSGYFGVVLASFLNVSSENFSRLPLAIFIQSIATLVPLFWISLIPGQESAKKRQEDKRKVF